MSPPTVSTKLAKESEHACVLMGSNSHDALWLTVVFTILPPLFCSLTLGNLGTDSGIRWFWFWLSLSIGGAAWGFLIRRRFPSLGWVCFAVGMLNFALLLGLPAFMNHRVAFFAPTNRPQATPGIASRLAVGHHWPGVPEPERSRKGAP